MPERVYFNRMQREVLQVDANTSVVVAGRGTGKGLLHAAVVLRNFQAMPRSTTAFVAPSAKRALTNTLPSMFTHWENWGYKRGVHYVVGVKPPRSLGWGMPLYTPDAWDNFITFYNGACGQIISQDRKGTSNSKSFDFIDVDEAKFVDFQQLKEETIQANRGQQREFGHLPFHHGMLVTSDMPVSRKGSWFMNYEKECDTDVIRTILTLQKLLADIKRDGDKRMKAGEYTNLLRELRRHATFYRVYSSLTNIEVLGEDFIRRQKRDLPPLVFQTSILCIPPQGATGGFYSSLTPRHKYRATDFSRLDSLGMPSRPVQTGCELDADILQGEPLCIAFDWNMQINWLVCGQPDRARGRLNVLKSFWVKNGRKVPELIQDFDTYYRKLQRREVVFYYDATARGSNYAVGGDDFHTTVTNGLRALGWIVREAYIGKPMFHMEKHLLINRSLDHLTELCPYFNEDNCADLLLSIESAGIYNGRKDKRGEKLAETEEDKLEGRTDGSDAFDTLLIGCLKYPARRASVPYYSDFR